MDAAYIRIDTFLSEELGFSNEHYNETKNSLVKNIKDLSDVLAISPNKDVIDFCLGFYKIKRNLVNVDLFQDLLNVAVDYKNDFIEMMPMLMTIESVNFITTKEDLEKFFLGVCKKVKFSAAELGDEYNKSYLKACVNVVDFSFFEELESRGISIKDNKSKFADVFTDAVKASLWKRIDKKIELLSHLKKDIYEEDLLLFDINKINLIQNRGKKTFSQLEAV
jgi:hypothetical protein